ncbi:SMP-30/gluconolactonase/LRE family protein [Chelatococcus asaccharovorans]|jgi:sugar lactone lactonase YvrE/DNA-binding IclR family transcriptional regulator|uniref:IclR family transcriptional regulator n=1 Tax=Chelatococcus asaccharovorans TaxID=28210 RepID=A0A2V3TUU3_9HYPH|nr:SMP-30/gluconolactonase/LRE family protein [Chelatococcus asaccharovorans]MBS7706154.1 SMP-30/gluconolactonase/LRE family protein [Chelatococcus asaccharovorans]PXW52529.1 IclR family transcriptional regulator [Chelatococcus asaccharovorans]
MEKSSKAGNVYAGTALKALAVFDVIADADRPLGFKDLMSLCGLPKATLHRMLSALTESGLVQYDPSARTYWLGMRLVDLAGRIWERIDFSGAFTRELENLRKLTGVNAYIVALEGFQVAYIDERGSLQEVRLYYMRGRRQPAYCTAGGKAILACLDPSELRRLVGVHAMTAYTPRTITDLPALQHELGLVRERQYAVEDQELEAGQNAAAAAILDHRNQPIAAIGIAGAADRLSVARCHELGPELIAAANRITTALRHLGGHPEAEPVRMNRTHDNQMSCVFPSTSFIGDSPLWCDRTNRLYWVDILGPAIHIGNPQTGTVTTMPLPGLVGSIALRKDGGILAALQIGLAFISDRGEITPIANPEAAKPQNRFNDGKCDASGRFWVSTMSMQREPGQGALYRLDPDLSLKTMETGVSVCNGPEWNVAGDRMYLVDNFRSRILSYRYDVASGDISDPSVLVQFPDNGAVPGGIAVDKDDHLWIPMWDGKEVLRITPQGEINARFSIPVLRPTSLAFGGSDLKTLFVTSSRIRMSATELDIWPLSGSVFKLDVAVEGRPQAKFAG